jgi:hypothetical protein
MMRNGYGKLKGLGLVGFTSARFIMSLASKGGAN